MNLSDGERLTTVLDEMGYEWTEDETEANMLGILACSVRQKAIDKVYSRIHKWNKRKKNESLVTFLSGCILPSDKEKFLHLFDIVFQMSELPKLPEIIEQYGILTGAFVRSNSFKVNNQLGSFWHIDPNYGSTFEAFVPIQNGCDKFCTFCAVPYTRGREISRPSAEILEEVKKLVNNGYKSITLLGQNVNSYGQDRPNEELTFNQLLRAIGEFGDASNKRFWLYYTSPHPDDMSADIFKTMASYKCIANQVHLPLQSGDDHVLIRMNRKHDIQTYRNIVKDIRTYLPKATLFTDIIVGFSRETEAQFENTMQAMAEFKFNMAYIAQYSVRPGSVSSRWEDDVPHTVKKDRFHRLTEKLKKQSLRYNTKLIGTEADVLIYGTDKKGNYFQGLTEGKLNVRIKKSNEDLSGQIVTVKIETATAFSLEGSLVPVAELAV